MNSKPTIVVVAFNRPHAISGLLKSLAKAHYPDANIRLVISLDYSGNPEVKQIAESFDWGFGEKHLIIHKTRLGLYKHVISCGDLTSQFGPVIVLEDDLEVSPWFYKYAVEVLSSYGENDQLAGFSLYSYQLAETSLKPMIKLKDGYPFYLLRFPSSWGQIYTREQWVGFKNWLASGHNEVKIALPPFVESWSSGSWKKDFLRYLLDTDKLFLFPKQSYTNNLGYEGTNFTIDISIFQVPLAIQVPEVMIEIGYLHVYDEYFEPDAAVLSEIFQEQIDVIDIHGSKPLAGLQQKKVLSTRKPIGPGCRQIEVRPDMFTPAPATPMYVGPALQFEQNYQVPKVEKAVLEQAILNGQIGEGFLSEQAFLLHYRFRNYLNVLQRWLRL